MTQRMAKLDRTLKLVHMLCDSGEGLTLDEMAAGLGVTRRTAERLRDVIALHFDVVEDSDGRTKRFRIRDALRRVYTRPTAAEIAALQAEADARNREMAPQAALLSSLLDKTKAALDDREKRRVDPDLEALVRLQRSRVPAGPAVVADPENLAAIQGAIMAGQCVEFDYRADGADLSRWRRVIPFGLVHGPITYLIGKMPDRDADPVPFRLDRMKNVRAANTSGLPPEDWDLDRWLSQSFGIWREEDHEVVLRVLPSSVERARQWRFHPAQELEETAEGLTVRFRAGGLREIAEHLFTWGGEVVIEGPDALQTVMRERLEAANACLRPLLTQHDVRAGT